MADRTQGSKGSDRDEAGDRRDSAAELRDDAGHELDLAGDRRDTAAELRDDAGHELDLAGDRRDTAAELRDEIADRVEAVAGTPPSSPAALDRHAAASDRDESSSDRRAGIDQRIAAEQDRGHALSDRGAGSRARLAAELDRDTALADRGAGARDRGEAEQDRALVARGIRFRAGLASDNARLYARQRSFSEALQRSLLTVPPESLHSQIAVRYVPATQEEEVGGDWYDAFTVASGDTVIAIGDVMGHDINAAMAMAQFRGLLRGIAYTTGDPPAALLTRVDRAVHGLAIGTMATAIVARLEFTGAPGRRQPRLRWSNAGHPPLLVADPRGHVQVLAAEADLLLGVDCSAERHERTLTLETGSTVLLYTDGLVERRGVHIDESIAQLMAVLASVHDLPLEEVCTEVLVQLLRANNEDDVALLAVRVIDT